MNKYKHTREKASLDGSLHSRDQFDYLLRCEQARADRTDSQFALLTFKKDDLTHHVGSLDEFVLCTQKRLRLTDQVGWLDSQSIGMLLPNTSLKGGLGCVSSLGRRHFKHAEGLIFRVFSYPHEWYDQPFESSHSRSKSYVFTGNGDGGRSSGVQGIREASEQQESRPEERGVPRWKRILDCFGASVGMILGFPVCFILAVYTRLVSPGPVLYRQERIGYRGRPFTFLKLRTMRISNDCSSHKEHLKSLINSEAPMTKLDAMADPRLIPGARVIRKLCLDELPQFVNVLRGEMSLVGPRPCLPYEFEEYSRWHAKRFDVLPGMTGLWQVSGKNNLTFAQMIRHDIRYVESMSPALDLLILLTTFPAIAVYLIQAMLRGGRGSLDTRNAAPSRQKRDCGTFSSSESTDNDWRVDA